MKVVDLKIFNDKKKKKKRKDRWYPQAAWFDSLLFKSACIFFVCLILSCLFLFVYNNLK